MELQFEDKTIFLLLVSFLHGITWGICMFINEFATGLFEQSRIKILVITRLKNDALDVFDFNHLLSELMDFYVNATLSFRWQV